MSSNHYSVTFKKVTKLADNVGENQIELALALAELEALEPGSVAGIAKTRPKARRKLYYLLKVGKWLKPIGQPHSRYAKIGWTKLAILAEHAEKHPGKVAARAGLARAEQCIAKQLPSVLNGAPMPEPKEQTQHNIYLRLTPMEYGVFEFILLKYGAVKLGKGKGKGKGLVGKEKALMNLLANVPFA